MAKYKAVIGRLSALPGGTAAYPSKTAAAGEATDTRGGASFEWETNSGWTSGFFPGLLWQLANETADPELKTAAATWTAGREVEKTETTGHDIGFMVFGSFGNGIQLDGRNKSYTEVL